MQKEFFESTHDFQVELHIHLPDKKFVDWCTKKYFINRGVYNVIDSWFYDYGYKNIINDARE